MPKFMKVDRSAIVIALTLLIKSLTDGNKVVKLRMLDEYLAGSDERTCIYKDSHGEMLTPSEHANLTVLARDIIDNKLNISTNPKIVLESDNVVYRVNIDNSWTKLELIPLGY